MHSTRGHGWVVVPDHGAVHVWLERLPGVIDGYGIVDRTETFLRDASVLLLEGPGWCTPRTWMTAWLLREHASGHGDDTLIESSVSTIDQHA
jgi:hypothetical protein